MLKLKQITKKYKNQKVLNNITINFPDTGIYTILGKSGSGKSTILNIISLIERPDSGTMNYNGINLLKLKKKKQDYYRHNHIGLIFQQYNLISHLNILDNLKLVSKDTKEINNLLRKLEIYNLRYKYPKQLSGGEQQRVSIIRSILNNPDILLCDEPTGALDDSSSLVIMKLLKDLSKTKLIILITHNKELAYKYSDKVLYLNNGEIKHVLPVTNRISSLKKTSYNKKTIITYAIKNIISKLKRNILLIIASSIGLITLLLVLNLTSGFKTKIDDYQRNELANYPIYISLTSTSIDKELNNIMTESNFDSNKVTIQESTHENKITKSFIEFINNIPKKNLYLTKYTYNDTIPITVVSSMKEITNNTKKLLGESNEVVLLVNSTNEIPEYLLKSLNLEKNSYNLEELLNHKFKINNKNYQITSIYSSSLDNVFFDKTGIFIKDYETSSLPIEIELYPSSYEARSYIKKYLNKNSFDIEYTDLSSSVVSVTTTLTDIIKIILILFSIMSLIVATLMIGILNYVAILEKTKEIGIMKSLGISAQNIKLMFLIENIIIALTTSIFSIFVVTIISSPLNSLICNYTSLNKVITFNMENTITIILTSILINIIGSYFPLKRINKSKIIDSIRYE